MQPLPTRVPDLPTDARDPGHPAAPWPNSKTGEGAASALESLKELEHKRNGLVPSDDRPKPG